MNRIPDSHSWVDEPDGKNGLDVDELPQGLLLGLGVAIVVVVLGAIVVGLWAIVRLVLAHT